MTTTPDDFPRQFGVLWGARDAEGLAALMAEDADMLGLTGLWAEGRKDIIALLKAELSGAFARSRLVTGKCKLRPLGPGAAVLHQRFVLSGVVDDQGRDLGRIGALLTATLVARPGGWHAVALQFNATDS
jgi:uncharacterized protein (TIGR02246 family)